MASNQAGNPAVGGAVPYKGPAVAIPPRSVPAGRKTTREGPMVVDAASGEVLGGTLQQVYVYETPVRIWHWVMMIAMIVLVATGYLIGSPWSGPSREATFTYFFGNIRLIHFLAGAVFVVAFVVFRVAEGGGWKRRQIRRASPASNIRCWNSGDKTSTTATAANAMTIVMPNATSNG